MTTAQCLSCLEPVDAPLLHPDRRFGQYHAACAKALFGSPKVPRLDLDLAKLHTVALAMVGHTSISGVQRKVSLGLSVDRALLQVATDGGRYLVKPQAQTFPSVPENEHLTMLLARHVGLEVPPCGLVRLSDESLAFLIRRFDRGDGGSKLLQEDFCQLAGQAPKEKYQGSAEFCAWLLLRYASEPIVETIKLFRLMAFSWWVGNGDLHLKNLSLLRVPDGTYRLSPVYDLVCTALLIPGDQLALPVGGNRRNPTRKQWLEFAKVCRLPERAAARVLHELSLAPAQVEHLVERSFLPEEMRVRYRGLLCERGEVLVAMQRRA
jgi:serine/threonine-protein kinase HipA